MKALALALCIGCAAPGDAMYAKPGQMVATSDGARLNVYCTGSGSPTVVLEAAYADWSPVWAAVQPRVSRWTRVCSYDRAGYGFSDPGPQPRSLQQVVAELHDALHAMTIDGPYILVSHATGTNTIRAFADSYLDEVAGLVLIDADVRDMESEPDLQQLWVALDQRNLDELHMCRDAVAAGHRPPITPPKAHPTWNCNNLLLRALPDSAYSATLNASLEERATKLALYDTLIAEKESRLADGAYLHDHAIPLGARPIRIITTGDYVRIAPNTPPERRAELLRMNHSSLFYQRKLLELSSNAKEIVSDKAYAELAAPEVVVRAIRDVYDQRVR